jgi:hypothetical protein
MAGNFGIKFAHRSCWLSELTALDGQTIHPKRTEFVCPSLTRPLMLALEKSQ